MNRPISLKDAARMASVSLSEMREHADAAGLYNSPLDGRLGEKKFFRWLDAHHAATAAARRDLEDREYTAWVEANARFLQRFLIEIGVVK